MEVQVKQVKLSQIKLNPDNPRTISSKSMDRLVKSLQDFPDMMKLREIVVDETMTVLGGNMRLLALKKIGAMECTAKVVKGLSAEQKREFVIKDNAAFGEWDFDALANAWSALPLSDWGIELPDDWTAPHGETETQDAEPQIDRAEELNKTWQVKTGDLFQIGDHRLLCGDSTKAEDVARVMGGEKARLVWTDPPYGVHYGEKMEAANPMGYRVRSIENDDLPADKLEEFIRTALKNASNNSSPGAAIYVASPAGTPLPALIASFEGSGFEYRWGLIWLKDQLVLSRADYHFKHENILYGWKPDGPHFFIEDRKQTSVFEYPRPKKSDEHPTMKPVELVKHMVLNSSEVGDVVYDSFGGSGTTMLACENAKRKTRMIELSENFCAVILQRMTDAFPGIEIKRVK